MRDYKLTLNLIVNDTVQSKIFKQFDTGNEIELELYENERLQADSKINLSTETVLAFFQLANNTVIQKNATIRNGNILITTTADVLSVEGLLLLECVIINGDKKTTTQTLQFTVLKSIDRNNAVKTLPTWDIIDALTKASESEQDRIKNESTRVSNENARVRNESVRVANEENRKTSYTQIQTQWQNLSKAIQDSNVGQTVVTEVIAARSNKEGKTYNNLGERIDTIEGKVTSRDYTEKCTNSSSIANIENIVDGKIILNEIQGNTLVNLIPNSKINETSGAYGFGHRNVSLKANTTYTFVVNGRIDQKAKDSGKVLRTYINTLDWGWSQHVIIDSLGDVTKVISLIPPINGTYVVGNFMYPSEGDRTGTVTVNWCMLLEGDYTQCGKNLFDKTKITNIGERIDETNGGGYTDPNGKYCISNYIKVKPNTQYVRNLYGINDKIVYSYAIYDENKKYIYGRFNNPINVPSNGQYIRVTANTECLDTFQLEEGTVITSYEPYITVYGNIPDYFEGMTSVNSIKVASRGKNLFDEQKWLIRDVESNKSVLKFNGYFANNTGIKNGSPLILLENPKRGTKYVVRGKFNKTTYFNKLRVFYDDCSSDDFGNFATSYIDSSLTITTNSIKKALYIYVDTGSAGENGYAEIDSIQIEEGATATVHEPYKEDKTEILLTNPLRKINSDIYDYIDKNGTKNINTAEIIFTGNESGWVTTNLTLTNTLVFGINGIISPVSRYCVCDKFRTDLLDWTPISTLDIEMLQVYTDKSIYVRILKSKLGILDTDDNPTILQKFKNYLNANNIKLQFQVNKTTEQLNKEIFNVSSFENGSLFIDSNIPCNIKYTYPTNLSSAISSLRDYTDALEMQITGLWKTAFSLADRELRMKVVPLLTTNTNDDLKNKINEILNIWR